MGHGTQPHNASVTPLAGNQPTPTHPLPIPTSSDLSLISTHLATAVEWKTHSALNSDHIPITISFDEDSPPIQTNCTDINLHCADCTSFTNLTEQQFCWLPPPTSAAQTVNKFDKIILDAAKTSIRAGYRKTSVLPYPRNPHTNF